MKVFYVLVEIIKQHHRSNVVYPWLLLMDKDGQKIILSAHNFFKKVFILSMANEKRSLKNTPGILSTKYKVSNGRRFT